MSDDNVLYDSPTEFLHEVAEKSGHCVAQSVIPLEDGSYVCACSCDRWEVVAPSRQEGLRLARAHTGSAP
ncbi:hypothetical protein [Amycolatopsis vastitatis]|uniref:Uncharacterized protein n=1 Tax=Amycolatopsis vastitatis TaxID=1905142 RepID=A0A229SYS3_9PSEU|nr:hypothetical protein [Amycolatopsis vastitatis]OXM64098.1 hypothetical protein CF165_27530 [Amycolatopsis vastitatis]